MTRTLSPSKAKGAMLCTVARVAQHLSLSRSGVYQRMHCGQLPYVKLGRSQRIRYEDVLKLIESHTIHGDVIRT
jgi:excisionase family DNA binding protein